MHRRSEELDSAQSTQTQKGQVIKLQTLVRAPVAVVLIWRVYICRDCLSAIPTNIHSPVQAGEELPTKEPLTVRAQR